MQLLTESVLQIFTAREIFFENQSIQYAVHVIARDSALKVHEI